MRILVTGAGGLLGLSLAVELSKTHTVIAADRKAIASSAGFETVQMDLLSPDAPARLLDETRPDAVIHCAALANVDACETDPDLAQQLNADLPGAMATAANRVGAHLVHISTDAVFDGASGGYTEEDATHPLSVYAETKLDGERQVFAAMPSAVVTRVNLFGWSASGSRSLAEFFYFSLRDGKPPKGFIDVQFCPILVNDLAEVFVAIFERKLSGLYHLVSPVSMTKYAFGVAIAERFGFDPAAIEPVSVADFGLKAARSPLLTLDTTKLSAALGRPLPDVRGGLERFYQLREQGYPEMLAGLVL
jgi:dTDP-4-dehydrorhamnose reductase